MNQEKLSEEKTESLPVAADKQLLRAEREEERRQEARRIQQIKRLDNVKLLIAAILLFGGLWAYYNVLDYIPALPAYAKFVFPIVGIVAALLVVFFWCSIGKRLLAYIRAAVQEVKKVVWPSKSYTVRLTGFVILFVSVLALYLYGIDTLISWVFSLVLARG